jgi:sulfur-oxidizing protein SoxZ
MAGIKAKAKQQGDFVEIKTLMTHPMETGLRKGKDGNKIPANHITEITVKSGSEVLMTVEYGPAISQNPYTSLMIGGKKKGDVLNVSWVDNTGKSDSTDVEVK